MQSVKGDTLMNCSSSSGLSGFSLLRTNSTAWALCLVCSTAVLLLPALWNGFAVVFFDTGGYVTRVMTMTLAPGRSLFYRFFLWAASWGWWSFWGPVLIQALATLWTIRLVLHCHDLPAGPLATTAFCAALGLLTGISWYTSQLMPDVFVPLVVLALWLLGFRWERLGRGERAGLAALALLGILAHMSCMALAVGLVAVTLMVRLVLSGRGWSLSVYSLAPAAVVAASLVVMPMLHLALVGKAVYTPGGPVFLFGRLVQDGVAQRWLAEHCPAQGIKLCGLQDRMPRIADEFLWSGASPFQEIGGWSGAADAELGYLVRACLQSYPGEVVWTSLRSTLQQMAKVATGDGLDEFQPSTYGIFSDLLPRTASSFKAARQQQTWISPSLFDALNRVHVPIAYLSVLGLLVVAGWGLRVRRHDLAGVALYIFLALLGNAFICGALSNPHDRYQSRLVWLAPLVVGMAVVCWWQRRTRAQDQARLGR